MNQPRTHTVKDNPTLYKFIGNRIIEARLRCDRNLVAPHPYKKLPTKFVTQTQLAKGVGVTFQQIQKYEKATNKISIDKLINVANFLKKPLSYFLPPDVTCLYETTDIIIKKESEENVCSG